MATRAAPGTIVRNSSRRFAANSLAKKFTPVRLPPGRLRLATSPILTGSAPTWKTIGIVVFSTFAGTFPLQWRHCRSDIRRRRTEDGRGHIDPHRWRSGDPSQGKGDEGKASEI